MARPHARTDLSPMPVLVEHGIHVYECDLILPKQPRGAVLFCGGRGVEESFCAAMVDALCLQDIAVLKLPHNEPQWSDDVAEESDSMHLALSLHAASRWLASEHWALGLAQGYFGVGAMAAPMLRKASDPDEGLQAVVIVEGSADMCDADLEQVEVPSLFIADGQDPLDSEFHREVASMLHCESKVILLDKLLAPPATAVGWFVDHFNDYYRSKGEAVQRLLHDAHLGSPHSFRADSRR